MKGTCKCCTEDALGRIGLADVAVAGEAPGAAMRVDGATVALAVGLGGCCGCS